MLKYVVCFVVSLLCLNVTILMLLIKVAQLHRDVEKTLIFVNAFLDSIKKIDKSSLGGGDQDA